MVVDKIEKQRRLRETLEDEAQRAMYEHQVHRAIAEQTTSEHKFEEPKPVLDENISVIRTFHDAVKTAFGPKGMCKMMVDTCGEVDVTSDGSLIIDEMDIDHPAGKMLASTIENLNELGDGATKTVILSGALLREAESLISMKLHPATVIRGYKLASIFVRDTLDEIAIVCDDDALLEVARTSLTSLPDLSDELRERIAVAVVDIAKSVTEVDDNGKKIVHQKRVCVERSVGGSSSEFEALDGIIINRDLLDEDMPDRVEDARIVLLDFPLEIKMKRVEEKFMREQQGSDKPYIGINAPPGVSPVKAMLDYLDRLIQDDIEKLQRLGVNVLFCHRTIDEIAQRYLLKAGIFAVKRMESGVLRDLEKTTGAKTVILLDDLCEDDVGTASLVEVRRFGRSTMIVVEGYPGDTTFKSVMLRGGTSYAINEVQRALMRSLKVVASAIEENKVITGGGHTELELALRLRKYANTISGKEQFAVLSYADALEMVPAALVENMGEDRIDKLVELRSEHRTGEKIDTDLSEPLRIERQVLSSATELACALLKIDYLINAADEISTLDQQSVEAHPDTPSDCIEYLDQRPWGLWDARMRTDKKAYWKDD